MAKRRSSSSPTPPHNFQEGGLSFKFHKYRPIEQAEYEEYINYKLDPPSNPQSIHRESELEHKIDETIAEHQEYAKEDVKFLEDVKRSLALRTQMHGLNLHTSVLLSKLRDKENKSGFYLFSKARVNRELSAVSRQIHTAQRQLDKLHAKHGKGP